jgi:hypothetical protein
MTVTQGRCLVRRSLGWTGVMVLALSLSACTAPRFAAPVGGALDVMFPDQSFIEAISNGEVPGDWVLSGSVDAQTLSIRQIDRFTALSVHAGNQPFALVRKINASLLATPYLSWAWHAQPPAHGTHPVSILIELTNREAISDRSWWKIGGEGAGNANRLIVLTWGETALGRGSIIGPIRQEDHPETARYIARGGPEQANRWWVDTVDLSLIHRQIWPADDQSLYDIRYIGISVQAAKSPAAMNLAEIRLMR